MTTDRDPLLDDALTLVKAFGSDPDGFVAMTAALTDLAECRATIVRLAQLVRLASADDLTLLTSVVHVMQTGKGDWPVTEDS